MATDEGPRYFGGLQALRLPRPYIASASLPRDAVAPQKPPDSVLRNLAGADLGIELRPWQEALAEYFASAE